MAHRPLPWHRWRVATRARTIIGAIAVAVGIPILAVVLIALLQPSSSKGQVVTPPGALAPAVTPARSLHGALPWDGVTRHWRLFIPALTGDPNQTLPLLVLLHPAGSNAGSFLALTQMDRYASQYHFMTVAPDGAPDGTWNAGNCCGDALAKNADDLGFIDGMLSRLISTANVDPHQIYVGGASNGGMLAYDIACHLSDRVQAVFSAGGVQTTASCAPDNPVTIVEFHSLLDKAVPTAGGYPPKNTLHLPYFVSTQQVFQLWSRLDACTGQTSTTAAPDETVTVWYGCTDKTLLEVWLRTRGGGHEWPTGPGPVDASLTIAKAIASHSLVRVPGQVSPNPLTAK